MIMFHALINEGRKEELSKSVMTEKFQQAGFHLYLIFRKKESISSNRDCTEKNETGQKDASNKKIHNFIPNCLRFRQYYLLME